MAPAEYEELQRKHGKDAAENEVYIGENRIIEIVAGKTGDNQGEEEQGTVFAVSDGNCG